MKAGKENKKNISKIKRVTFSHCSFFFVLPKREDVKNYLVTARGMRRRDGGMAAMVSWTVVSGVAGDGHRTG